MYKLKNLGLAVLMSSILLGACKKKDDPVVNNNNNSTSLAADQALLQSFFDNNRKKPESFTLDASLGGSIFTQDGTQIVFTPTCFTDLNGNPVTGTVDLQVTEFNVPSEMILGNKPTVDVNGEMLISEGEFMVTATANNQEVMLRPNAVTIIITRDTSVAVIDQMRAWSGDTNVVLATSGHNHLNAAVTVFDNHMINPGVLWNDQGQAMVTGTGYEIPLDSLGNWANCDAFAQFGNTRTTLLCYMSVYNDSARYISQGIQPSMVLCKPLSINSVTKLYHHILDAPAGYKGMLSTQNNMPVGEACDFLAITAKDGKFYAELKSNQNIPAPATGDNYSTLSFNMQEVSEAQLLSMIQSLD